MMKGNRLNGWTGPLATLAGLLATGLIAWGVMQNQLSTQVSTDSKQDSGIKENQNRSILNKQNNAVLEVMVRRIAEDVTEIKSILMERK